MIKISVIAPVYNVEDYLEKSADSILKQKLKDFELILVDDGSTDRSGYICDQIKLKDDRVKVLHIENGGAANARNQGIKIAKGEYLYFIDPDDWCDENLLQSLYDIAEDTNANLVIQGFVNEYSDGDDYFSIKQTAEDAFYDDTLSVRHNIYKYFNNTMIAVPWNKLYRKSYIVDNHLEFPNVKWDDLHFNMEVIKNISKVAVSSQAHYHFFRTRPGSETTKVFDEGLFDRRKEQFEHILDIYKYWNMMDDRKSMQAINYYFIGRVFQCIQEMANSNYKYLDKKRKVKKILSDSTVKNAIRLQKGPSRLMNLFIYLMKKGNATALLVFGNIISIVKNKFSRTFYKIRRNYLVKG